VTARERCDESPPDASDRPCPPVGAAYLAPAGFEQRLADELCHAGIAVTRRHGRLFLTAAAPRPVAWAANVWLEPFVRCVASIRDAADQLRACQRNWVLYAPEHRGRARLIEQRLPHVSARPLAWGDRAPAAPLGSWTLLTPDLVLASAACVSRFPHGEVRFVEDRTGPPSRAYLKLWEAFEVFGARPGTGDVCLDLGASPGGWTWLLARCGARVIAVDKAPIDPHVAALPTVDWRQASAYSLSPDEIGPVDWWCSDVVAYPRRLLALVDRWLASGNVRNLVCTVKLQGPTDPGVIPAFLALPGAQLRHLHHNKHELTLAVLEPAAR
jgi:23S rRNA (cytidine2498-2'-O)-methyltransferase